MNGVQKQVFVALSGGVDSAACACILKQQYPNLKAVYMRNWDPDLNNDIKGHKRMKQGCSDQDDLVAVKSICTQLNLELIVLNFVQDYWNQVFVPTLDILQSGATPNPDVLCNKYIKFGVLFDKLQEKFGHDFMIATGHYAKVGFFDQQYHLMTPKNKIKDQTYFLNQLNQEQLAKILFPLSDFTDKNQVRELVKQANLAVWNKKDSTGICFIGERNYKKFMNNYIQYQKGPIVNIDNHQIIGTHDGLCFYTIYQRKNLNLSGHDEAMYVCDKDVQTNTLYVCKRSQIQKYIYADQSIIEKMHWISKKASVNDQVYVRFRHTGILYLATVIGIKNNIVILKHDKIITTAPGQYVTLYSLDKTLCFGGGILVRSNQDDLS